MSQTFSNAASQSLRIPNIRNEAAAWRLDIHPKTDGPILTQRASKLYKIIVGLMRKENKRTIWMHDGATCQLIAAPMSDLRKILSELRDTGYLFLKQSRFGCQFSLEEQSTNRAGANG
jgi:hypothetical protein